jgi:hypothetical protein
MFALAETDGTAAALDPSAFPDAELEAAFATAHRRWLRAGAERLRLLAEIERRRTYRRDGYVSAHAWLAERFGEAAGTARSDVRLATGLRYMPVATEAMAAGELSTAAARILAQARSEHPEAFAPSEAQLVEAAVTAPADDLRRRVAEWSTVADAADGIDRAERLRERRHLAVVPTPTGMVRVAGELDPETGETVVTALGAIVDAGRRSGTPDGRSTSQRWADALAELGERYLASPDRPAVAGERPHVAVTVDLGRLRACAGTASFDQVGAIPAAVARRLACDAAITRIVLGPRSEPLDVGRRTPVVPPAIRRALVVRDGRCRFPACDRPHPWTDAHHVVHWADGGETSLGNLVLLCREHHRLIHGGLFQVEVVDERPVFRRQNGTVIEDGRAPP